MIAVLTGLRFVSFDINTVPLDVGGVTAYLWLLHAPIPRACKQLGLAA